MADQVSQKLTYFGMVGVVMAALKLKDRWDGYNQLSQEEEGRIRLPTSPTRETDDISMLDTQIPGATRPKRPKRKGCCVCCGLDCTLFWKAIGIVLLIFTVWNGFKLIKWAITPSATGLESMPVYRESLGCLHEGWTEFKDASQTILVGSSKPHFDLDIQGAAVGTLTIAEAVHGAVDITLESSIRSSSLTLLDQTVIHIPDAEEAGHSTHVSVTSPAFLEATAECSRFDLTLYVPPTLMTLKIATHSVTQVRFHPDAHIMLDDLSVRIYAAADDRSMILPHANVHANNMKLDAHRGWIVGDIAIDNSTSVTTSRGDATTNLHVRPSAPLSNDDDPAPAYLETLTGAGRTDIFYESDSSSAHRRIVNSHVAAKLGDIYLFYKQADYSGTIDLVAKSYSTRNMQGVVPSRIGSGGIFEDKMPWVGDENGEDKLTISSPSGWVGLYF